MGFIGLDDRSGLVVVDARIELGGIEPELRRVLLQVGFRVRADILPRPDGKELIVVFPKLVLLGCTFSRFRGPVRFADASLVDDGVILVCEGNLVRLDVLCFDLATRAKCKVSADRSLKVGEFDEGELGVWIPRRSAGGGQPAAGWRRRTGRLQRGQR